MASLQWPTVTTRVINASLMIMFRYAKISYRVGFILDHEYFIPFFFTWDQIRSDMLCSRCLVMIASDIVGFIGCNISQNPSLFYYILIDFIINEYCWFLK
jgi:hypothetical protein